MRLSVGRSRLGVAVEGAEGGLFCYCIVAVVIVVFCVFCSGILLRLVVGLMMWVFQLLLWLWRDECAHLSGIAFALHEH